MKICQELGHKFISEFQRERSMVRIAKDVGAKAHLNEFLTLTTFITSGIALTANQRVTRENIKAESRKCIYSLQLRIHANIEHNSVSNNPKCTELDLQIEISCHYA